MALAEATNDYSLQLKRTINASPEQVFNAWTDPELVSRWLGPDRAFTTTVHELDLTIGGRYRFEMSESDGSKHTVGGEYVAITPPSQLVFTWAWEHVDDHGDMLVTVDFVAVGDKTEMTLTHEKFADANIRDLHDEGWQACLAGLDEIFK